MTEPLKIIAIESAVSGGSLALMRGGELLNNWHGQDRTSRSEELLPRIAEMLVESGMIVDDLDAIAVSNGPGSYTGIRIGLATAQGLALSHGIRCVGVSLLSAISGRFESRDERIVTVPIGRTNYCWQLFTGSTTTTVPAVSGSMTDLIAFSADYPAARLLLHADAFQDLTGSTDTDVQRAVDLGRDLAVYVGLAARTTDDGLTPFYARENSATVSS